MLNSDNEKYKPLSKKELLKLKQSSIKTNFNEDTVLKEDLKLNFIEKIKLFFTKKERIVLNQCKFGYHPEIVIKRFKNQNILIKYIEGSTKELL
jgi:hypothetical protein